VGIAWFVIIMGGGDAWFVVCMGGGVEKKFMVVCETTNGR